ncbi:MAG: YraN family protein [Coxiellaceae bacterium]|nr:YraN family protein [Coxiellaceae bacterium]
MGYTQRIGSIAEQAALNHLRRHGLRLFKRNFRSRYGEIDLIMQHKTVLVFVEVRYRRSQDYGGSILSITELKQQRIIRTAQYYLFKQRQFQHWPCRFDVVGFDKSKITWIKHAFEVPEKMLW